MFHQLLLLMANKLFAEFAIDLDDDLSEIDILAAEIKVPSNSSEALKALKATLRNAM